MSIKKLLFAFMLFVPFVIHSMEEKKQAKGDDIALFCAIWSNNHSLVMKLLNSGVSVDAVYQEQADKKCDKIYDYLSGLKPLHMAAFRQKTSIMQTLLSRNASVDQKASRGRLPLHAALYGVLNAIDDHHSAGRSGGLTCKDSPDRYRALQNNIQAVRNILKMDPFNLLVSYGADIAAQDDTGATLFHLLAQQAKEQKAQWWAKLFPTVVIESIIKNDLQLNTEHIGAKDKGQKAQEALVIRLQDALQKKDNKGQTPHDIYSDTLFKNGSIIQDQKVVQEKLDEYSGRSGTLESEVNDDFWISFHPEDNNTNPLKEMVKKAWESQLLDS